MSPGLRILTISPRIDERDGVLRARSSILVLVLTLGGFARKVVIDRRSRYITITERSFWFLRQTRVIPFRQLQRIEYDYSEVATSLARGYDGQIGSGDEIESFRVGLVLRPREDVPATHAHLYEEQVHLFGFHGDGRGKVTLFDAEGQQQSLSRHYVERIRALTGIGFGHELAALHDPSGRQWSCAGCGRPGPPRARKCYYCGGTLEPSAD